MESLNRKIKRHITIEELIKEEVYPFSIKPIFSIIGSIITIAPGIRWQISFVQEYTLRKFLGFKPFVMHKEFKLSQNLVDVLSFNNMAFETDIAQATIFQGELEYFTFLQWMLILLTNT